MKKIFILLLSIGVLMPAFAQYTTHNFVFEGINREYLLYVPPMYNGAKPVPLLLTLHGLGDDMDNFKNVNFKAVADTANFIYVVPQALVDGLTGSTAWNSGAGAFGISLNPTINDVGFLSALIDSVSAQYNIDQKRIYSTGFSMGGFMSNRLACELNNKIAAIASVSGTIGGVLNCKPNRAVPVAHFHGTADQTVAYTNNLFGNDAEELVSFWVQNNLCQTLPIIDSLPNLKNDGKTVIKYTYEDGIYDTKVVLFKIVGGDHEWLTNANDITYTSEIWKFLSKFEWQEQSVGVNTSPKISEIQVFPNPSRGFIRISLGAQNTNNILYSVIDNMGKTIFENKTDNNQQFIILDTNNYTSGVYVIKCIVNDQIITKKILISK